MKRLLHLVALVLFATVITKGQTTEKSFAWEKGKQHTDELYVDGERIRLLVADGLGVSVTLKDMKVCKLYDKFVVRVVIDNQTADRVLVDPANFSLQVVKPNPKDLKYESVAHLTKSMNSRIAVANALGAFGAAMKTTESNTRTSSTGSATIMGDVNASVSASGTSWSTTTQPDYQARQRADEQARELRLEGMESAQVAQKAELRTNTVMPGKTVAGIVVFEREKKAKELVLNMRIGDVVVTFPLENEPAK